MARKERRREQDLKDAQLWKQRHTTATTEQQPLFERFKDNFDILYAVKSNKNVAPWRSKIYVPILAGKAWDFIAKLSDIEPRFIATIRDEWELDETTNQPIYPEAVLQRAQRISRKLEYDWKNPFQQQSPREKVFETLVDTVATGTGLAKITRKVTDSTYRAHPALGENGNVDTEDIIQQTVTEGRNCYEPVNIFNVKFAPYTQHLQAAPWIIIDDFKTLDELRQDGVYDEAVLGQIDAEMAATTDPMSQYSVSRNRLVQTQDRVAADHSVKLLAVHECYSRNAEGDVVIKTYIENAGEDAGWVCARTLEDPYWHNLYPLQTFYLRRRPYSVWGEGLFDNNATLQYASNDVINHYMDNLNISLDGMVMMEENALVEDFVVAPGEMLLYRNEEPKQFKFNEPNPNQLSIVMQQFDKAVEAATISQYASGTPNSANDKTQGTATGVTRIMEAAEDKLGFMYSNFKASMEGVGFQFLVNDQQFMDRPATVPHEGPDGLQPMVVTPLDLQGVIDITLDDESLLPVSKVAKRQQLTEYVGHVTALQQASIAQAQLVGDPTDIVRVNFKTLLRDISLSYGQKSFSQYFLDPPQQLPQTNTDKPKELLDYKDAPEDIKRQMERAAGFQPSTQPSVSQQKQDLAVAQASHKATMDQANHALDVATSADQSTIAHQASKQAAKQSKEKVNAKR